MIEINLLPPELRKKRIKVNFSTQGLWFILPLIIGIFVFIHLVLASLVLVKNIQKGSLNRKWTAESSSKERVDSWKKEFNLANQDSRTINSLIDQRVIYADKLKIMSELLPGGIWFTRLEIKKNSFTLEGSVVSLESTHMSTLRYYIERLKEDPEFFSDFASFKLGPVRMR